MIPLNKACARTVSRILAGRFFLSCSGGDKAEGRGCSDFWGRGSCSGDETEGRSGGTCRDSILDVANLVSVFS